MRTLAGGAFLTSRELFKHPIWQNIVEFRLFFLIYGNAIFSEEGHRVDDTLTLQRGQWLRSTRKLQEDLQYIEDRKVKQYSTATINRAIKRLVALQRVCTKTHELGTVFTVLNYEQYQAFEGYAKELSETGSETVAKQQRNNNKNVYKGEEGLNNISPNSNTVSKVKKKKYADHVSMTEQEYEKLIEQLGSQLTQSMIDRLNDYKGSTGKKYKSDYHTILNWRRRDLQKQSYSQPKTKQDKNNEILQRHMEDDEVIYYDGQASDPAIGSLFDSLPYNDDN